jgi:hypothetical protein
VPAEKALAPTDEPNPTPELIARHLRSDRRLTEAAASQIAELVEELYYKLVGSSGPLAVHLRSAKTFTPSAAILLAEVLAEMQASLEHEPGRGHASGV